MLKPAPKITKELCNIDWRDTSKNIYNLIRGLSPYPTAFTYIQEAGNNIPVQMKIFSTKIIGQDELKAFMEKTGIKEAFPGMIISDNKSFMAICTEDGAISINELQMSGKRRMDIKSFLSGFRNPMDYKAINGTSKEEIDKVR